MHRRSLIWRTLRFGSGKWGTGLRLSLLGCRSAGACTGAVRSGDCYAGQGTDKDKRKAFSWYALAAEQNIPRAMWNLGEMCARTSGIEPMPRRRLRCANGLRMLGLRQHARHCALFAKAGRFRSGHALVESRSKQGDL